MSSMKTHKAEGIMYENGDALSWYAVRVFSKHEKSVASLLRDHGYDDFVPTYRAIRRWSDRQKVLDLPLFPGYVFSRFEVADRWRVAHIPGAIEIVHFGRELARIDAAEIDALRHAVESGVPCEPWPYVQVGELVEITSGPLKGLSGPVIRRRDQSHLVLSIALLRRSVLVHVERFDIRTVKSHVRADVNRIRVAREAPVRRLADLPGAVQTSPL
jgi:transcription antitermination factor NusG